jgi:hypothetical protein
MARATRFAADLLFFPEGLYVARAAVVRARHVRAKSQQTRERSAFLRNEAHRLALDCRGRVATAQGLRRVLPR